MSVFEIEQKYRLKDPAVVRGRLKEFGARKIGSGREENEFFDRQGQLRKRRIAMRLRRYGKKATLTVKGPRLRSKFTKRMELETEVDYAVVRSILLLSGFEVMMRYHKHRELYQYRQTHVTIDRLAKFGSFLEIEGTCRSISRVAADLGLEDKDRETRSYLQMIFGWKH